MRRLVGIVAFAALVFGTIGASAGARVPRIVARVQCNAPAEDTLAHVRMVDYTHRSDGTIVVVYRCERTGY